MTNVTLIIIKIRRLNNDEFSIRKRSSMPQIYFINNNKSATGQLRVLGFIQTPKFLRNNIYKTKKCEENDNVLNVEELCRNYSNLNEENMRKIFL